jgi:toxin YhaV
LEQLEKLMTAVERDKATDLQNYKKKANTKLLSAIFNIAFERIPADPTDKRYRMGDTLGANYKHWFSDKFGNGRFRLFFRFDSKTKIIIYAWVNDENNLREYGAKSDAYAVFSKMLASGNPPDSWDILLGACKDPAILARLEGALNENPSHGT